MMCPLRFGIPGGGCNCLGSTCAWWDTHNGNCAMVAIARIFSCDQTGFAVHDMLGQEINELRQKIEDNAKQWEEYARILNKQYIEQLKNKIREYQNET